MCYRHPYIIRYVFLLAGLSACLNLFSQQKCDSISLSQEDKVLLQNFWMDFKYAVNNKDKAKLSSLCRFPFICDYCILDTNRPNDKPYIKVSKNSFDQSQYKIFFAERLIKEINRHNLPQDIFIFQPYYNTIDKKCSYSFSYVAIEENAQHPGRQHLFDIQNVNGRFKIISAWTIP
jgi:hypothetical protein